MTTQRELFEKSVIERLKESGFLEVEIRVECLVRCGDGYQDEVINAGWHYWNAAIAAKPAPEANLQGLPRDVVNLVIAAREFWDANNDLSPESRGLDEALSAFSERVPYENQPEEGQDNG